MAYNTDPVVHNHAPVVYKAVPVAYNRALVGHSSWHVDVLTSEPLSKCSVFFLIFSEVACFSALYVEYVLESRLKSFRNPPNNIKASV